MLEAGIGSRAIRGQLERFFMLRKINKRMLVLVALATVYAATRIALITWAWIGPNGWMYANFADLVSTGRNPYTIPSGLGGIAPELADYPPFWMVAFGALAQWFTGGTAVKAVCYAGDLALMAAAWRAARNRTTADAAATLALVTCNLAYVWADVWMAQYKSWAAAGLLLLASFDSALVAGLLAGAFVLPAALPVMRWARDRDWRALGGSTAVAAALWLPWFPSSFVGVFARRAAHLSYGYWGEALGGYLPTALQPCLMPAALALGAWVVVRGGGSHAERFAAAAALATAAQTDAMVNRWLPFALVPLLAAPLGARLRWVAVGLCTVCGAAVANVLIYRALQPAWMGLAMYAPLPLAVWAAARRR